MTDVKSKCLVDFGWKPKAEFPTLVTKFLIKATEETKYLLMTETTGWCKGGEVNCVTLQYSAATPTEAIEVTHNSPVSDPCKNGVTNDGVDK